MNLSAIQAALVERKLDGWLFYDFRGSDPLAFGILGLDRTKFLSRRWFYYVPAYGEPVKLVHAIEPAALDSLPGAKHVYLPWQQLHQLIQSMLANQQRVAMQYSPNNNIPYVSRVDAGTLELIRSYGVEVVSSADLVQQFEATIDEAGFTSHEEAAQAIGKIVHNAFAEVGRLLKAGKTPTEYGIQQFIEESFAREGLEADHPAIVGVGPHSADPHFAPDKDADTPIRPGDFLLIDLWAKQKKPNAIYADITWTGFLGTNPPAEVVQVFNTVRDARDAAVSFVQKGLADGRKLRGCDVDDACRHVIQAAGFGDDFIHRTGHSIHVNTHGNGTNIDNLETHDDRPIAPHTCFSVEPGIYLPGRFGVRTEINVFVKDESTAVVTGIPAQRELLLVDV